MPAYMDLPDLTQGDTFQKAFSFKNQAGQIMDVSPYDWWLTIKLDANLPDDSPYSVQAFIAAGEQVSMANGTLTFVISEDKTANLIPGVYGWELQRVKPITEGENETPHVTTLITGEVEVLPQLTHGVTKS